MIYTTIRERKISHKKFYTAQWFDSENCYFIEAGQRCDTLIDALETLDKLSGYRLPAPRFNDMFLYYREITNKRDQRDVVGWWRD